MISPSWRVLFMESPSTRVSRATQLNSTTAATTQPRNI